MGSPRRIFGLALVLGLGLGAILWVAQPEFLFGGTPGDATDAGTDPRSLKDLEDEVFQDLRRRATLSGRMPGIHDRNLGSGVLTGRVLRFRSGGDPIPLAGVEVSALALVSDPQVGGRGEGRIRPPPAVTDASGTFRFERLPGLANITLLVQERGYRAKRLSGFVVRRDAVTDVGDILLGAPTTLRGEVVDAKGRALRGAVVKVFRDRSQEGGFDLRRGLFELKNSGAWLAEARVGNDGMFQIEDLPPGRYVIRVSAPGHATAFRSGVVVTWDELSSAPRIVLDPGVGYQGRVDDEHGRPIAGARVIVVAIPGQRAERVDKQEVRTNARGEYRIDTLIPGLRYFVEAWAEGYAPMGAFPSQLEQTTQKDFTLPRSGRLEGRILDAVTGEGIPKAEVTAVVGGPHRMSPLSTVTDATGAYAFPHAVPGPLLLFSATAPGYAARDSIRVPGVDGVAVVGGETVTLDWELATGARVAGHVRDARGRPLSYVTVALVPSRAGMQGESSAITKDDGSYTFEGVRPGRYELRTTAPGYAPITDDATVRIEVADENEVIERDITLQEGAFLTGVVRAPDGMPQPGAVVTVATSAGSKFQNRVRDLLAVTDGSGTYRLPGVPPGVSVHLLAQHDAWSTTPSEDLVLSPGERRTLDVTLSGGSTIDGSVVDARGIPVVGARIRWGHVEEADRGRLRDSFRSDEFLGQRVLRSDESGHFRIENLQAGLTLIKVEKEGYADWYRKDLVAPVEPTVMSVQAELVGAMTIRGRVLSTQGDQPIRDAYVYAVERDADQSPDDDPGHVKALVSAQTDDRGEFALPGLPPGTYRVVAWFVPGHVGAVQSWRDPSVKQDGIAAGSSAVLFRLAPVGTEADPK